MPLPGCAASPEMSGSDVGALAQGLEFQPDRWLNHILAIGEGAEAAIRAGDDALAVADDGHRFFQAPRDNLWVLDDVAVALDHARQEQHVAGQLVTAQRFHFVLVARIAELDAERADIGLIEHGQD